MALTCRDVCTIVCAALLLTFAISGPIFAFFVVSCTSTAPCQVEAVLARIGAKCDEGPDQSKMLLHDEVCTVICPPGSEPTSPQLMCDDGTAQGASELVCEPIQPPGLDGGLVKGAVTGGLLREVCPSTATLECNAVVGGTAIFVQYPGIDKETCSALLDECRGYNEAFDWGEFAAGMCTLGCFAEIVIEENLDIAADSIQLGDEVNDVFSGVVPLEDQELCDAGPMCYTIAGACTAGVDGDYYRFPVCSSGASQWVKLDESFRLRYDERSLQSIAGRWLLELPETVNSDLFGQHIARQPSYTDLPLLGSHIWDSQCVTQLNSFTTEVDNRLVEMSIRLCTCTAELDCNGNGVAVGSKALGPNCRCYCDRGWSGEHCEFRICRAPAVLNANRPACQEGWNLAPGDTCTPACKINYFPTVTSLRCTEYGNFSWPHKFECKDQFSVGDAIAAAQTFGISTNISEEDLICGAVDCNNNGVATGWGSPIDDSCECTCNEGFSGSKCEAYSGACPAPLPNDIEHSQEFPCAEGRTISTICTPQCDLEYYPLPELLTCTPNGLYPPTFSCYGGPSVVATWCNTMRYTAIAGSCIALATLIGGAVMFTQGEGRSEERFERNGQKVEVGKDGNGIFNIIRREQRDMRKTVPVTNAAWIETLTPADKVDHDDVIQQVEDRPPTPEDDLEALWRTQTHRLPEPEVWAISKAKSRVSLKGESPQLSPRMRARADGDSSPRSLKSPVSPKSRMSKSLVSASPSPSSRLQYTAQAIEDSGPDPPELTLTLAVPRERSQFTLSSPQSRTSWSPNRSPLSTGPPWNGPWQTRRLQKAICKASAESVPAKGKKRLSAASTNALAITNGDDPFGINGGASPGGASASNASPDASPWGTRGRPGPLALEDSQSIGGNQTLRRIEPDASPSQALAIVNPAKAQTWQKEMHQLQATSQELVRAKTFHVKQLREEAETGPVAAALASTQAERLAVHADLQGALLIGDTEALRAGIQKARALLVHLAMCPPTATAQLVAVLQVAEARVEQYEFEKDLLNSKQAYRSRVEQGKAADWKMTPEEFQSHVEQCSVEGVKAGLRALLPVSVRSGEDELTLLHYAIMGAVSDNEEEFQRREEVISLLIRAKAQVNAEDNMRLTPLDYALEQGGENAEALPVIATLRAKGFRTSDEARAEARAIARGAQTHISAEIGAARTRVFPGVAKSPHHGVGGGVGTPPRANEMNPFAATAPSRRTSGV